MARSAPRASASRITCATRAGPAEQTTTSPPCFSLQPQRLLERVGVGLVHLVADVLLAIHVLLSFETRLPLAGRDLLDADGYLHGYVRSRTGPASERSSRLCDGPRLATFSVSNLLNSSAALVPPKPNEFDSAYVDRHGALGVRARSRGRSPSSGMFQVDRRRRHLVMHRQRGDAGLEPAGRAEQVPGHRLGRRDGQLAARARRSSA